MKYCVDVPNFGAWADPRRFAEFAGEVAAAGWDGISVWDHILVWDGAEVADPWVLLAAAALKTERIRLMSMVTPIPAPPPVETRTGIGQRGPTQQRSAHSRCWHRLAY